MPVQLKALSIVVLLAASGGLLVLTGCTQSNSTAASQPRSTPAESVATSSPAASRPAATSGLPTGQAPSVTPNPAGEAEHPHKPGSHGGIIVPIGADSYHAEAVVEKTGELRLLTLGKDESRILEVEVQSLKAYVKITAQPDAIPVELAAVPQEGDAPGKTSQFVGELPEELRGKPLDVTIPNLRILGERFRVGFTTAVAHQEEEMPAGLPAAEEQALYFTPAGKYSEADIEANGRMTASQKFKGILSSHDMKPKPGDRLCPITLTKANPKFTWIVDGKPYEFCCPPCVDEFVKLAKEQPDEIKEPDAYFK